MKTLKPLFFIIFALVLLSPSFSEQRNLSTPLSRLWGHWVFAKTGAHFYFSKVTKTDETGSFITVNPAKAVYIKGFKEMIAKEEGKERELTPQEFAQIDGVAGKAEYRKYKLLSQEPNGKEVLIGTDEEINTIVTRNGKTSYFNYQFLIDKNGSEMDYCIFISGERPAPPKPNEMARLKYVDAKTTPEG